FQLAVYGAGSSLTQTVTAEICNFNACTTVGTTTAFDEGMLPAEISLYSADQQVCLTAESEAEFQVFFESAGEPTSNSQLTVLNTNHTQGGSPDGPFIYFYVNSEHFHGGPNTVEIQYLGDTNYLPSNVLTVPIDGTECA